MRRKRITILLLLAIILIVTSLSFGDISINYFNYTSGFRNLEIQSFSANYAYNIVNRYQDWNGISSNVSISSCTVNYYTNLGKDIRFQEGHLMPSVNASTSYFSSSGKVGHDSSTPVIYTKITLHHDKLKSENKAMVERVILHELGHALALGHPSTSCNENAIMHQTWRGNVASYIVRPHDKENLIYRQGN